jgi:hypothetical protein
MHYHSLFTLNPFLISIVWFAFYDSSVAYFRTSVTNFGLLIVNLRSYVAYLKPEVGYLCGKKSNY